MGEEQRPPTEEDFASWIPAKDALAAVGTVVGWNVAHKTIITRLANDLLRACAKTVIEKKTSGDTTKLSLAIIPTWIWKEVLERKSAQYLTFWDSNDWVFEKETRNGPYTTTYKLSVFTLRFEREGLREIAPHIPELPSPAPIYILSDKIPVLNAGLEQEDLPPKGPPLAAAALLAWYEAYKLAYKDHERNLEHAWARAKSAFPEKTVTRANVRTLMPGGKPGPRPKD